MQDLLPQISRSQRVGRLRPLPAYSVEKLALVKGFDIDFGLEQLIASG
jgi:hypothetical protein